MDVLKTLELFSAGLALENLTVTQFQDLVRKLFPQLLTDRNGSVESIGEDTFADIRVLVIRKINNIGNRNSGEDILRKKNFFIYYLCEHLQLLFRNKAPGDDKGQDHREQIITDLLDLRNEGILSEIREMLKDIDFWIYFGNPNVAAPLAHFLQHFTSKVEDLWFNLSFSENEAKRFFQKIHESTIKIKDMRAMILQKCLIDVFSILPHITKGLYLDVDLDLEDADGAHQEFCTKLEEEITDFNTNLLQTENVRVQARNTADIPHVFLIGVVLRKGAQFIRSEEEWDQQQE